MAVLSHHLVLMNINLYNILFLVKKHTTEVVRAKAMMKSEESGEAQDKNRGVEEQGNCQM